MSYSSSNFIKSYNLSDRVIQIQNSLNQKVFSLNVCNENKIYITENLLVIILEDNTPSKQYILDFPNATDASIAFTSLKSALDTLKPNCSPIGTTPPSPSSTPIEITYLEYKSKQSSSELIALQWYDVTDGTNLLNLGGGVIRLLAKSIDDYEPSGLVVSTKELVTINTLDDSIQKYEFPKQKILALNKSKISYDSTSAYLTASTNSILNSTTSTNIEVGENSTLNVTSSNYIKIYGKSNVTLTNATNVTIDNIQQDLSSIGFNLLSVIINQSDSLGKNGRSANANINTDKTFISYKDTIDQVFNYTTNNNTINIILDNKITQSNGLFRLKYAGNGTGNIINVLDIDANLLYTITDTIKNSWAVFKYNKSTSLFEFSNLDLAGTSAHTVYQVSPTSDGQTIFLLPVPATVPSELEMYVNGNKVLFGSDFTYTSPNQITFQNRLYSLSTNDELEFIIY